MTKRKTKSKNKSNSFRKIWKELHKYNKTIVLKLGFGVTDLNNLGITYGHKYLYTINNNDNLINNIIINNFIILSFSSFELFELIILVNPSNNLGIIII